MHIACLDLEGVLIPEVWIEFSERARIPELRATTRDVPDYDVLMRQRLRILNEHKLGLPDIQAVISEMTPLPGAGAFLNWLRERYQVVILSDTYYEFAAPLMKQLGYPTLLCHKLGVDKGGRVVDYHLRQPDRSGPSQGLSLPQLPGGSCGDSYNDTSMLAGGCGNSVLPPDNVLAGFRSFR